MKKFLSLLLLAILAVSLVMSSVGATENAVENVTENWVDASVQDAAAYYDELMESFSSTYSMSGEKTYPDYYGGSYINDEGQFVVYVTNDMQRPAIFGDNADIIYEPCTYSYNELRSIMDTLNDYKFSYPDDSIARNFNAFGLYDSENRVIVRLDDLSDESIKEFKENVCNSDAIEFKQGYGTFTRTADTNVYAGDKITDTEGSASLGYRVKRNGVMGFVTAGHVADKKGEPIKYNGTTFASCEKSQIEGSADAAFCAITNPDYFLTNTLSGTRYTLSTTISEPGVGTVINKIGMETGHTTGKVVSTDFTLTFSDGLTNYNLTAADYECDYGDSGGVVYSYIGATGARPTLGIVTGAGTGDYEGLSFYSKANEVNAVLGSVHTNEEL